MPTDGSSRGAKSSTLVVGGTLVAVSAWWALRKMRRSYGATSATASAAITRGRNRRNSSKNRNVAGGRERFSIIYTDRTSGQVGSRGEAALQPPIPYLEQFLVCLSDLCHPETNPGGHIPLCVAENRLVLDLLAERFMRVGTATAAFSDSSVYCYNSFLGMPVARESAAYFLARRFLFPDDPDLAPDAALQHIKPKHVAIGSGTRSLCTRHRRNGYFFSDGDRLTAAFRLPVAFLVHQVLRQY